MPFDRYGRHYVYDPSERRIYENVYTVGHSIYPPDRQTIVIHDNPYRGGRDSIDDYVQDSDGGELPCAYKHPIDSSELKKMEQDDLIELFNRISAVCLVRECYGNGGKVEDLQQTQLRIDTILVDRHDQDQYIMSHKDDIDWKKKGWVFKNGQKAMKEDEKPKMIKDSSRGSENRSKKTRKSTKNAKNGRQG